MSFFDDISRLRICYFIRSAICFWVDILYISLPSLLIDLFCSPYFMNEYILFVFLFLFYVLMYFMVFNMFGKWGQKVTFVYLKDSLNKHVDIYILLGNGLESSLLEIPTKMEFTWQSIVTNGLLITWPPHCFIF